MTAPEPKAGIMDIAPYKGGDSALEGKEEVIKLSSNETPLGPSPRAIEAFRASAANLHLYPDGGANALREAIAAAHDLPVGQIVCGNGSDELISLLCSAYAGEGDEVLYSEHGFLMYRISALGAGATPVTAAEDNLRASVDNLLAAVSDATRIVFIANPNNPTGSYLSGEELARLRAGLPENVLLVIDAAYAEYVGAPDYSSGAELVARSDNTIMLRTFSKIYGLAALRVGWGYASEAIIDVLQRVRGPFNVNAAAQAAATAAVGDREHLQAAIDHNDRWLPWLHQQIGGLGLEAPPSVGNFLLIRFPGGAAQAAAAERWLHEHGIILRAMGGYGLGDCLRMTVGTEEENRAVIAALASFLKQS